MPRIAKPVSAFGAMVLGACLLIGGVSTDVLHCATTEEVGVTSTSGDGDASSTTTTTAIVPQCGWRMLNKYHYEGPQIAGYAVGGAANTSTTGPPPSVVTDVNPCPPIESRLKAMGGIAVTTILAALVASTNALLAVLGQEYCGTKCHNSALVVVIGAACSVGCLVTWAIGSSVYLGDYSSGFNHASSAAVGSSSSTSSCPSTSLSNSPFKVQYGAGWALTFVAGLCFLGAAAIAFFMERANGVLPCCCGGDSGDHQYYGHGGGEYSASLNNSYGDPMKPPANNSGGGAPVGGSVMIVAGAPIGIPTTTSPPNGQHTYNNQQQQFPNHGGVNGNGNGGGFFSRFFTRGKGKEGRTSTAANTNNNANFVGMLPPPQAVQQHHAPYSPTASTYPHYSNGSGVPTIYAHHQQSGYHQPHQLNTAAPTAAVYVNFQTPQQQQGTHYYQPPTGTTATEDTGRMLPHALAMALGTSNQ